jgi:hypothetical protein
MRPPLRHMLLRHPIRHANMEPLKPYQSGWAQDPRFASVQEDGLHYCLVKLGADSWGCILFAQHLSNPCPRPAFFAELALHSLDVIIILQE